VFEALTGAGLAASAGLNAWIPLLSMGLLSRYTHLITLPHGWVWLSNGWVLLILTILLAIELVADKIPLVDHVNDMVHTVIRPTAGGIAFGASSMSQTRTVTDPGAFFRSHQWVPIAAGVLIALGVHGVKASARPVVNATTFGIATPFVSTAEDVASLGMSLLAIVLPVIGILFLLLVLLFFATLWRRRRKRKAARATARAAAQSGTG
jgi:uncharacterized protein DUF4126